MTYASAKNQRMVIQGNKISLNRGSRELVITAAAECRLGNTARLNIFLMPVSKKNFYSSDIYIIICIFLILRLSMDFQYRKYGSGFPLAVR